MQGRAQAMRNKIPSGGLSRIPGHAGGLVGNLAKSISMSADINKKPSFNQITQYGYAFDVSIDIANDQRGPFGLGRNFKQDTMKKLVCFCSTGWVLAAASMAVQVVHMYALDALPRADNIMLHPASLLLLGKRASKRKDEVEAHRVAGQSADSSSKLVQEGVG